MNKLHDIYHELRWFRSLLSLWSHVLSGRVPQPLVPSPFLGVPRTGVAPPAESTLPSQLGLGYPPQLRLEYPPPSWEWGTPSWDWSTPPHPAGTRVPHHRGLVTPRAVCLLRFPPGGLSCYVVQSAIIKLWRRGVLFYIDLLIILSVKDLYYYCIISTEIDV